jgi:DNA-binding GntR family transcriptional regulator
MSSTITAEKQTPQHSVVDHAVIKIRRLIYNNALRPGEPFSLRGLADQLGMSFIPLREALRSLETQGLVVTTPGKSAMIAPLDRKDLRGIYRIRLRLEPEIASRACELLSPGDFDRLDRILETYAGRTEGIDEIYDAHHELHLELLRPAATEWDLRVLEGLWRSAERYVRLAFGELDADPAEHHRRELTHQHLVDTFRTRDPQRTALALAEHLEDALDLTLRSLPV